MRSGDISGCAAALIGCVDLCAGFHQKMRQSGIPDRCRLVKRSGARATASVGVAAAIE
jgi:hypothetical protein